MAKIKKTVFLELLSQRQAKSIKRTRKKYPKWLFPTNAEKKYDKILYSLVRELKNMIKEILLPEIPSMIYEVKAEMPNDRADAFLERLGELMIYIKKKINPKVDETIVKAAGISFDINQFNKTQSNKFNEAVFGFDLFLNEPWLADQLKLFSVQNAELIQSLPDQELSRVAGDIERGLQQGLRHEDIAKTIQKSFGITHRRATLIARDQTTKLNASLTMLRQREVGVEEYEWQTSGDERVRPTHRANDGKRFKWSHPPAITGHPGHDVNCRCVALPILDNLLDFS